uniref:Uncharacterized protein n=1 Tax=Mycena chlorophos TaxID=658473 RepID=A0ABQ0LK16_MYCCL|nr:predicted protein [Mycena chlorophos]
MSPMHLCAVKRRAKVPAKSSSIRYEPPPLPNDDAGAALLFLRPTHATGSQSVALCRLGGFPLAHDHWATACWARSHRTRMTPVAQLVRRGTDAESTCRFGDDTSPSRQLVWLPFSATDGRCWGIGSVPPHGERQLMLFHLESAGASIYSVGATPFGT